MSGDAIAWVSTRGGGSPVDLVTAIDSGLAPDGGLYVPERMPQATEADLRAGEEGFAAIAARVLKPFVAGTALEKDLAGLCADALNFALPLRPVSGGPSMLELFHGPTAAFKDAGARFLARALARLADGPRTIVVATSGDTGGAVASAFHGLAGMNVAVLFPEKGVSPFQRKQLTCWGGNVRAFAVAGTFDDCQRMVKAALASGERARRLGLTSANSISVGRLLPQIAFYAAASLWQAARSQGPLQVVVPTGNLGNGVAALYARAMGYPIEKIALASNANRPVPDYLASGRWNPRPSQSTLANAMDVGDPSNGARLTALEPDRAKLSAYVTADSATDDEIRAEVRSAWREWNVAICPHTAAGLHLWRKLGWGTSAVVAATAHPSKFHESLEAEGVPVHWPATLRAIREKPTHEEKLSADPEKLLKELEG